MEASCTEYISCAGAHTGATQAGTECVFTTVRRRRGISLRAASYRCHSAAPVSRHAVCGMAKATLSAATHINPLLLYIYTGFLKQKTEKKKNRPAPEPNKSAQRFLLALIVQCVVELL